MLNSTLISARKIFWTTKKWIIGCFRTIRSLNATDLKNAVFTHGMVNVHVGSRAELVQLQETAFGRQKS
jgi:hypothetical protein